MNVLGFVNTSALTKLRRKTIPYFIVIVIKLLGNK